MFTNIRFTLYITVIICVIPDVFTIKCWTCRSSNDPKCGDPFDNTTIPITDCNHVKGLSQLPGVRPMCLKIRQKVNGQQVIIRDCTWKRQDDYGTQCPSSSNGTNEVTSFCETCEHDDGCNGAATIGTTIALLATPLSLLLFK